MQPTYAAAQVAADRIHRHLATVSTTSGGALTPPDTAKLATLIDAAFWTSLRREEGYIPRISLAFVEPGRARGAIGFASSLSLDPKDLTKLAAAVERAGLHLGVWPEQEELRVWGITRNLPASCLVLEVILPGLIVVKQSPAEESGKFINVAVLQGDEIKIIDPRGVASASWPLLFPMVAQDAIGWEVNVLLQLAVSVRAHGRGGLLVVVPAGSASGSAPWTCSGRHPITYAYARVLRPGRSMRKDTGGKPSRKWEDALGRAVDSIAGLTAVDGATLITTDYELLAFGAKIVRREGSPQVGPVIVTEPIEGGNPSIAEPAQFGGTRHQQTPTEPRNTT